MSKLNLRLSCIFAVLALLIMAACRTTPENGLLATQKQLNKIVDEFTEKIKRLDAYEAPRFNVEEDLSKFGDYLSDDFFRRKREIYEKAAAEFKLLTKSDLIGRELVLYNIFDFEISRGLKSFEFPGFQYWDSFNQMGSRLSLYIDDSNPELTSFPFDSVKHYRDYVSRASGFLPFIDYQIAALRKSQELGYTHNCEIAKVAVNTYSKALETNIEKNPFYRPILSMPASFSAKEQDELRAAFSNMIQTKILPGYKKFDEYYRKTYLPKCRKSFGVGALPNGNEVYSYMIWASTDLKHDAKTLHAIGLKEVARILAEMDKIRIGKKFKGTLPQFLIHLTKDPTQYFKSANDLFSSFSNYKEKVDKLVPKYFSLIPKTPFRLVASENPEDAAASYRDPSEMQPVGRFVLNTANLKSTPIFGVQTLYIHEAIPGHHFQLALQFEMRNELNEFQRKIFGSNSFVEGWALYTERLGRDEGWLTDEMQLFGSLSDEMLRAVRLVVDTGIHAQGWSRKKAIQYMQAHLASDIGDIENEIDRYSVWPGQALSYKVGQLKILELRDFAKKELGANFDIREFHSQVLKNGTVSLPVLEAVIKGWVEKMQKPKKS